MGQRGYGMLLGLIPLAYPVFLASFFLSPHDKFTNNLFYLTLLIFLFGPAWAMLRVLGALPLGRILLAYLAYHLLTVAWSEPVTAALWRQQSFHSLYVLGFILMGLWVLRTPQDVRQLLQLVTGAALVTGGLLLAQALTLGLPPEGRLSGWEMLGHPGLAATLYGSLWLWWFAQPRRRYLEARTGVLLGLGGVMLLTQSRGPLLALLVCIWLGWLLQRRWVWFIGLLVLGGVYTLFAGQGWVEWPAFFQRHGWDSYRLEIWRQAWQDIQAAPLFGQGATTLLQYPVSSGRLEPHPHSLYLTAWVRGGIIELVLLLALLGGALWQSGRTWRRTGDASLSLQLSFAALTGLTDGSGLVQHPLPFWLYFWLPVTLALGAEWHGRGAGLAGWRRPP